jgi:hypothetical protein
MRTITAGSVNTSGTAPLAGRARDLRSMDRPDSSTLPISNIAAAT